MIKELGELQPIEFNRFGFGSQEEWMVARNLPVNSNLQMKINRTQEGTYLLVISPPKGNNIVIESEDLQQLSSTMETIQLNMEKDKIIENYGIESTSTERVKISEDKNKGDPKIMEQMQGLCNDILRLYGITELEETFDGYDDFIEYLYDLAYEQGIKLNLSNNPEIKSKLDMLKELDQISNTYILTSLDDIRIGGEQLTDSRETANFLIENAKSNEFKGAVDLSEYPDEIQNYLLKFFYNQDIELTDEQLKALNEYKGADFTLVNEVLRGNFENIIKAENPNDTIERICRIIMGISSTMKSMPERKYDLVIGRKGTGAGKKFEVGEENEYDSFVSFGTNDGTSIGNGQSIYTYKRILGKDTKAIPMELVCTPEILSQVRDENEMLVNPFTFEVSKMQRADNGNTLIMMANEHEISVEEILIRRLRKLAVQSPNLEVTIQKEIQKIEDIKLQEQVESEQSPEQILSETVDYYGQRNGLKQMKHLVAKVREQIQYIKNNFKGNER